MANPIETAFVEIKPDTRGFGRETQRQVRAQLSGVDANVGVGRRGIQAAERDLAVLGRGAKRTRTDLTDLAQTGALLGPGIARGAQFATAGVLGLGASIGVLGGLSVKAAIDVESSFTNVRKTVEGTESELAELREDLLGLSLEIPVDVNELNQLGGIAGQLGIARENVVSFVDTVAKLGVTTNLSGELAATTLARLANITGTNQSEISRLGSTVVELGNNMATTEAEISEFGLRIAGAGKIAGLTEAEILAIGATLSSLGVEAEAGGTAVQKVLLSLATSVKTGGDRLKTFADVAGQPVAEFVALFEQDAGAAFQALVEGLARIEQGGGSAALALKDLGLQDQRLLRSFLALSGNTDLLDQALRLSNEAWDENTALTREAELRFATTASQLQLVKNEATALAVEIGDKLVPGVGAGAEALAGFLSGLREGEIAGDQFAQVADLVGSTFSSLEPIFDAVSDAGDDLRNILSENAENFRKATVFAKPFVILIGGALLVSLRLAIKALSLAADVMGFFGDMTARVVGIVVSAVDKFLGAFSGLADVANKVLPGDPMAGVADSINRAREELREFKEDLAGVRNEDPVEIPVTIAPVVSERAAGVQVEQIVRGEHFTPPEVRVAVPDTPKPPKGGDGDKGPLGDIPTAIRRKEQRLRDNAEIARLQTETIADDRKALQELIGFYREQAANQKFSVAIRREFQIAALGAQRELSDLEEQAADDAQRAAEDSARARQERLDAAVAERRGILEANVKLAELTEATVRDDVAAFRKLIGFLRERVSAARRGSAEQREALVELREAQAELRDIQREAREDDIREREDLLKDNRTLASFTENSIRDDEKALGALIRFYAGRVRASKRGSAERRKWLIELRRSQKELRDLREEEKGARDENRGTTAFELLTQQADTFREQAGNLIGVDQPFREVTDFLKKQAELLTRREPVEAELGVKGVLPDAFEREAQKREVTVELRQKQQRDKSLDRLIEALNRNTDAQAGRTGRGGRDGGDTRRAKSGAVNENDRRWREGASARAAVAAL